VQGEGGYDAECEGGGWRTVAARLGGEGGAQGGAQLRRHYERHDTAVTASQQAAMETLVKLQPGIDFASLAKMGVILDSVSISIGYPPNMDPKMLTGSSGGASSSSSSDHSSASQHNQRMDAAYIAKLQEAILSTAAVQS